jgi:predicted MPP superfamily phosphohydrolase
MKTLAIPDIHTFYPKAQRIIEKFYADVDKIILLGDYFDQWDDTVDANCEMAKWILKKLADPKMVCLMGNHEMGYRFPTISNAKCSGWSRSKSEEIKEILKKEDWDKLPFFYFHNKYCFSHAGIDSSWACHPINGFSEKYLSSLVEEGIEKMKAGEDPEVFAPGQSRGGWAKVGGIIWNDFNRDFKPIEMVNQVFGHTPAPKPRNISWVSSDNWCLDCNKDKSYHLNYVGLITDGTFEVVDTTDV